MTQRYQRGSLRCEKRSGKSDVWVWRYRVKGTMRQETFEVSDYRTKSAMWQHLEPSIQALNNQSAEPVHVAPTLGDVIKRYIEQEMLELAKSTRDTQSGELRIHIEPRWGAKVITEIQPGDVQNWIETLKSSSCSTV